VSTADQELTVQIKALKAAGCDVIRKRRRAPFRKNFSMLD